MRFEPTALAEVVLVEPDVFRDERGFFLEVFNRPRWAADGGLDLAFVQENHSRSRRGTLRGLHAQIETPQGKLVRCPRGEVFDVAVDARVGSPTFGRWVGVALSEENFRQLWVPPGFLHGFCALSEVAEVEYRCTAPYDPASEVTVAWDDPEIGIAWPVAEPLLSPRDASAPRLAELSGRLFRFREAGGR
ncbi:MAG TPA: dTDP-4-dehydrorhamnose 3,5-epimerase [Thermoanaerobaculia bacterium]|nr:dTDP-4-dehydrorhamnose 3,5-epimerase [Thermoanaerobaculia bacterium]